MESLKPTTVGCTANPTFTIQPKQNGAEITTPNLKRVETELQREVLAREGCDLLQGYLFSAPLSVSDIENLLYRA